MSVVSHSEYPTTRSKTSAQKAASRKPVSGSMDEMDANSDDEDYRMHVSDESEESRPLSDADSDSDSLGQDQLDQLKRKAGPSKIKNKGLGHRSGTNKRSVQAQAVTTQLEAKDTQEPGGFKFLHLESYVCYCADSPLQPWPSQCKVLTYFALVFLDELRVVYCPTHNMIVPMSEWATHVREHHTMDWHSGTKKRDCAEMAKV
jgi:hypothetical protein